MTMSTFLYTWPLDLWTRMYARATAACDPYIPWGGVGWLNPGMDSTYEHVRRLNGNQGHVEALGGFRTHLSKVKNTTSVMLALFAGVGAALIAVPATEESHWSTTAFFLSAILLAIGGVIIGAILPLFFRIFFGEDINVNPQTMNKLTWPKHRVLLLSICVFFCYPSAAIALSCAFLVAGIFALTITANFFPDTTPTSTALANREPRRLQFVMTSLGPFVGYMVVFLAFATNLCWARRRARRSRTGHLGPQGDSTILVHS
ncbi:hypothetical protein D9619_012430 [Psilocybe cf. subviscida]|uniref:Uncharacterized protein n=1 Tax=Psilocybe cf. subviscida TaxID=2480587 RepID=A0A8H5ARE9_9AGAR|nr:hypothetical protein D9619_012430 [Psilocybe cf. subviscida]